MELIIILNKILVLLCMVYIVIDFNIVWLDLCISKPVHIIYTVSITSLLLILCPFFLQG